MKIKSIALLLFFLANQLVVAGCTIISIKQDEKVYVGNNEDWYIPYTKYRTIPGNEKTYGRIVFSYNNNWGQGGMNEKGLFFDWVLNSEESNSWERDPLKKDVTGNLSERILAECASVEEALKYYEEYNEPIFSTSYIVLVDTSGHTAFVSWEENKIEIKECKGICIGGYGYHKIVEKAKQVEGEVDKEEVRYLLDAAHQEGEYPTLYSNIYDLKSGIIHLYYFHNFKEEVKIDLQEILKEEGHSVEIKSLFKTEIPKKEFRRLQKTYLLKELGTIPAKGWLVALCILSVLILTVRVTYKFAKKILSLRNT